MSFWWRRLHRTVSFKEVDRLAMLVGEYLKFNVAGMFNKLFDVDSAVPKGFFSFAPGDIEFLCKSNRVVSCAHTSATPRPPRLL